MSAHAPSANQRAFVTMHLPLRARGYPFGISFVKALSSVEVPLEEKKNPIWMGPHGMGDVIELPH